VPKWLVSRKTSLLLKCADKGTVASSYHPITCLPTLWKLFSGILSQKMWYHIHVNNIIAPEQKGVYPGRRTN